MKNYLPGFALFIITLIIGLLCYQDYGISWDEPTQRGLGLITNNYVEKKDSILLNYDDRALGTSFELPLIWIENAMHQKDSRSVYLMRHLVSHIFFLLGVLAGYALAWKLFRNHWLACLAFILLAFHPRIYAHSYFNSKDIPFLSAFLITMLLSHIAFTKDRPWWYLLLGICGGYAAGIRAIGVMVVSCILLFLLVDFINARVLQRKRQAIALNTLLFLLGFGAMFYSLWPFIWTHPVFHFREALHRLSTISWDGTVLFNGKFYPGMHLPWYYSIEWFAITTPVIWIIAGLAGTIVFLVYFLRTPIAMFTSIRERNFLMYMACMVLPVAAVVINHSAVIDDWRHLYFVYVPFVFFCLYGLDKLSKKKVKQVAILVCYLQMATVGFFMVKYHPHQQVYFNELVSHEPESLRMNYDLEYWGCAYKQGLEYILAHDSSAKINIFQSLEPVNNAWRILPEDQQKRVNLTDEAHANYFIAGFRNHRDDFNYPIVFYEIKVQKSTIMRVYKMHP